MRAEGGRLLQHVLNNCSGILDKVLVLDGIRDFIQFQLERLFSLTIDLAMYNIQVSPA